MSDYRLVQIAGTFRDYIDSQVDGLVSLDDRIRDISRMKTPSFVQRKDLTRARTFLRIAETTAYRHSQQNKKLSDAYHNHII